MNYTLIKTNDEFVRCLDYDDDDDNDDYCFCLEKKISKFFSLCFLFCLKTEMNGSVEYEKSRYLMQFFFVFVVSFSFVLFFWFNE